MACFAHFTWQRLQPLFIRQLYDSVSLTVSLLCIFGNPTLNVSQRRRNNWIHLFFTLILPLLWAPLCMLVKFYPRPSHSRRLVIFSNYSRYVIVEDIGPMSFVMYDVLGFIINALPQCLGCVFIVTFNGTL